MNRAHRFVFIAAACLIPALSHAQMPEASLRIRVVDDSSAVIVGARVVVTQATQPASEVVTGPRGEVVVAGLAPGPTDIRVESAGFEARVITGHRIRSGANRLDVTLKVERLSVSIEVSRDAREKQLDPRGDAFTHIFTSEMIAQLPDDPEELERVLTQLAGPGATIRVNGFGGARLPSKSQIRSIRISFNTFSAELHELGVPIVDIQTQPGLDRWRVASNVGFRNDALTARYPYASSSASEEVRRGGISIDGPLWRNRTSMSFAADTVFLAEAQTVLASVPAGQIGGLVNRATDRGSFALEVEHALTKTHTSRLEFAGSRASIDNLGVGGADLPGRAYSTDQNTYTLRIADNGSLGKKLFNQFRVQRAWTDQRAESATAKPAVIVLDAFNAGGAQVANARQSWELEVADDVDMARGRHAMRAGVLLQAAHYQASDESNAFGTFTFSGLEAYEAGRPTTFTQRVGEPLVTFGFYRLGWYLQDDVKAHKTLTVSAGLRHEIQSQVDDRLSFSPRVGVTWAPIPNGKLVVRGGVGLVYSWLDAGLYEQTLRVDGTRQYDIVVTSPGFPNPLDGAQATALPPSRLLQSPRLQLPRLLLASMAVQRQVSPLTTLMATYTSQRGARVFRGRNLNAPLPGGGRPFPEFGNVTQVESTGSSALDRIQVALSHAVVKDMQPRLVVSATYILSRQNNDSDGPFSVPSDSWHPAADWGASASDVRHIGSAIVMAMLPHGFRMTVIASARSASPYNITTGFDDNQDTVINDRPPGVTRNSGRGSGMSDLTIRAGWTVGFGKAPAAGGPPIPNLRRLGSTAERDPLGGVGALGPQANRYRVEFYAQAYNAFNRVNPTGYRGVMTSPYFGQPTASLPPRRVELGLRFDY